MRITDESQLLDQDTRRKLIAHFGDQANMRRKHDAFKAYECLKDKTSTYVMELLLKKFDPETVHEMQYAISNISVLRKVIDKLAKVYANGVKRTMASEADTKLVEESAEYLKINTAMKKANRYFRTFKNTLVHPKPMPVEGGLYDIKLEVLPPFHYDAVENANNPEEPLAIVISDYHPTRKALYTLGDVALAGRGLMREVNDRGDMLMQAYAAPTTGIINDGGKGGLEDHREFIWWTKNLHFTTNAKGEILSRGIDEDYTNPIRKLPFINFAGDQDGQFWAEGGQDLVDAGVAINVGLTDVEHIGVSQGYGQLYMTGKNLPKSVKVGPNVCLQIEQTDKDDPAPTVGYLNSNPPIDELKGIVEMKVALMLSTNNLSVSSVATSLSSGKDFASGIALMIDKSESIEDIGEQAQVFIEREPKVWGLVAAWAEVYDAAGKLSEDAVLKLKLPKNPEAIQIAFPSPKPVVSEQDQLAVLKLRKELGLNTEVELLMRDDPSLSEDEARTKLEKIKSEKQANAAAMGLPTGGDLNGNQGKEDNSNGGSNNNNAGLNSGHENFGNGQKQNQE